MKKYFLLALMFVLCTSILIAIEIHVYPGDSIQQAVNNAASNDVIVIHPYDVSPFYYAENVNLDSFNGNYLTITGEDPYNWNTVEQTYVKYEDSALPVFYTTDINILSDITINIKGIKIESGNSGIQIVDTDSYDYNLNIERCIFRALSYPIKTLNHTPLFVDNCIFRMGVVGISSTYDWDEVSQTDYLLNITGCEFADLAFYNITSSCPAKIDRCTFFQDYYSSQQPVALYTRGLLTSSIIAGDWSNGITILGNNHDYITVRYSNIVGGVPEHSFIINEVGNIDADPLFADTANYVFQLNELSPCIDTGDPFVPLDPDDTRADMGCYYFHHDYDIKLFEEGIQWVSFPYLTYRGTHNGEIYQQAYYENDWPGLLQLTLGGGPTINGFEEIEGESKYIKYNYPNFDDQGFNNMLFRHEGYKIKVTDGADPTTLMVHGERLEPTHTVNRTYEAGTYHWLGFWLPGIQKMIESFGELWQYVEKVKSEDWFYSPAIMERGGDPTYPVAISAENLTLEYGKTYLVKFNEDIDNFHWTSSIAVGDAKKNQQPENFTYTEKADYEAVDVFNIPPSVTEIGVFEDEVCVGAVVVEDSCAQILVYSDNANRDPIPFTFELVTGRGLLTPVKKYQVLNMQTGKYETKSIFSGRQEHSILRFDDEDKPENEIPSVPQLNGNYPNPFNPTTTISFSVTQNSDFVTLEVYNIKGQKVKTLYSGTADVGEHTVIWEGKDNNDKPVSSGIYFYKLKTNNKELTRKMLMMK